jgi:DNA-directed RNA polymerase subunit RPC12/RpoP
MTAQFLATDSEKAKEITDEEIVCNQCGKKAAEIFQATGDYCIECWQIITHTEA